MKKTFLTWVSLVFLFSFLCLSSFSSPSQNNESISRRKLLSSSSCGSQPDFINNGGFVLYMIGVLYLFLGISIICEGYFVKSLEAICEKFNIPEDIGGATFMAAGSSAPELFASFVSLANDNASNDIGVSTIVGSAVFNILCIVGLTALCSPHKLILNHRSLLRDGAVYAVAIISTAIIFYDGKIYWWEGLICVGLYGGYLLILGFIGFDQDKELTQWRRLLVSSLGKLEQIQISNAEDADRAPVLDHAHISNPFNPFPSSQSFGRNTLICSQNTSTNSASFNVRSVETDPFQWPDKRQDQVLWILCFPWHLLFSYTVPNCSKKNWTNYYMLTFVISIIWIGIISWFMVEWTAKTGCVLGIPSVVMGVTVLAAGTSLPDAFSSLGAARLDKADMAIANAVGSNIFDIWLGLGLPWLLIIPFKGQHGVYGTYLSVENDELLSSVCILFAVLAIYLLMIAAAQWKLFPQHGYVLIFLYLVYAFYYIVGVGVFHLFDSEN